MSFFSSIGAEFKKIFGKAAPFEVAATNAIAVAAPLLETVIAFADPAAAPAVTAVVTKIQGGLATLSVLAKAGTVNPSFTTLLSSIESELPELLTAAQVKDPASQAKITAVIDTVLGEIKAIQAAIPAA